MSTAKKAKKMIVVRRNPPRKCKRPRDTTLAFNRNARRRFSGVFTKLHFDTLPVEPLENILRFASERPYDDYWHDFVNPLNVLAMLKSGGALSDCVRGMFDRIEVNEKMPAVRHGLLILGKGSESRTLFPKVVNALSDVVTEIRVTRPTFPNAWKKPLESRMSHLKKLIISMPYRRARFPLSEILAAQSGQLETLELAWRCIERADVKAIEAHCEGLRSLALNFAIASTKLGPIWTTTGRTLEELSLGGPPHNQQWQWGNDKGAGMLFENMRAIGTNCKGLRRLDFSCVDCRWQEDMARLCVAYGEQLESLSLSQCRITPARALRIREACRNVRFDVFEVSGTCTPVLVAMGSNVASVSLGPKTFMDIDMHVDDKWKAVSEKCSNLTTISLHQVYRQGLIPESAFNTFLSIPKKQLKVVKMEQVHTGVQMNLLKALGEHVQTLEEIDIFGDIPRLDVLEKFAEACPTLRGVKLRGYPITGTLCVCHAVAPMGLTGDPPRLNLENNWGLVVEMFLKCPKLVSIDFACSQHPHQRPAAEEVSEFVNVCHPARHRRISISICNRQYV